MPTGSPSGTSPGAQTLERGLAVLRELGRHDDGLSTAQVAEVTGLHRTVVHRLLVSLVGTGFARRDDRGRHHVGPAVAALAARATPVLRDLAGPLLQDLADRIGLAVSLVEVEDGAAVTTLVAHPAAEGPQFAYRLGHREPLDRGAGGVAAAASAAPALDEPAAVAAARAVGYAVTHGELNPGAHGVAVPLPGWAAPAAATVVSYDPAVVEQVRTPLLATAAEIGRLAP